MIQKLIYRENLLDHYKNPRNFGEIKGGISNKQFNPLCGDEVEIFVLVKNGKVKNIKFKGIGCAISIAATSMLTERVNGMSLEKVKNLKADDMFEMLGIKVGVNRIKCVTLSLKSLMECLRNEFSN